MSSINSVLNSKAYSFLDSDSEEGKQKKKQIVTEREGNYYCTYIVDGNGNKVLLQQIPADQVEEKKTPGTRKESSETAPCDYKSVKSARTAFECKQQMNLEKSHKQNLKEIMNILEEYAGIPQGSGKTYDF
jgi:hypothetical protein